MTTKQVSSAIPAMGSMAESTNAVMTGGTAKNIRYSRFRGHLHSHPPGRPLRAPARAHASSGQEPCTPTGASWV